MDMQQLRERLMPVFLEELNECVSDMQRYLASLQRNPEQSVREMLVNELYRAAHKIKGAANAVELGSIEHLCRQMQDILMTVRDGQRSIDSALLAQFVEAVRFLDVSAAALRDGSVPGSGPEIFQRR
ncbi:MAG: Hpt domain-containing protein [Planctomycetaceae bacterium]